jgi:prephenate dehydrogenase
MWSPIFWQNRDYICEALEVYIRHLEELKESLKNNNHKRLSELIVNANKIRGVLEGENSSLTKNEETIIKLYTK